MDMLTYLRRSFDYDDWANHEALSALRAAQSPSGRSLKTMAHIIGAQWLWLSRLQGEKPRTSVWPEIGLDDCRGHLADLAQCWREYLSALTEVRLSDKITYTNSIGERWTNTVLDTLTHVTMHSVYHRGQIASALRESGNQPAYTDFIHCVRQGYVK